MNKLVFKVFMLLAVLINCIAMPASTAMAAKKGWTKNSSGAWTYVNKDGNLAHGYCKYNEGDRKYYFFWEPGYVDEDGNEHEMYTLAWNKIICKESTGEPLYVASEEGPLLTNYEIQYNGNIYRADSKGVLTRIGNGGSEKKKTEERRQESGDLWITGESLPDTLQEGKFFPVKGIVRSDAEILTVFAEIVDSNENQKHAVIVRPNSSSYDLAGEVDENMIFNDLAPGSYIYRVHAEDSSGNKEYLIWKEFEVVSKQGRRNSAASTQTGTGNISSIYQHQETHTDCTVTSVLMMLRSKAVYDGGDWGSMTLSGLKSKYWSSSGMAWSGSYGGYSFSSDSSSIKNNSAGGAAAQLRYDHLVNALSMHPEGVVLYIYDTGNSRKAHAVFVTRVQNGVIYCLDPYGDSREIPLANSITFNQNFGYYDQDSILRGDNTVDYRSFLWWCAD